MSEWSDESEKILCCCGVVSFSKIKQEGDPPKYILKDSCLGCGRTDDVDEICSIQKISHKKAEKIVEALCNLVETGPLQILNGRTASDVANLAQHIEDVGRPHAASRIRKGLEAFKGGDRSVPDGTRHRELEMKLFSMDIAVEVSRPVP